MILFSRQDSNCSVRGRVAVEGTSSDKNETKLENVQQPVSKVPVQASEIYLFFCGFSPRPFYKKMAEDRSG